MPDWIEILISRQPVPAQQVGCADFGGNYAMVITNVIDPAGHRPFTGDPFSPLTFSISGSNINVAGSSPFVPVSGTISQADCSFQATGRGTVAGYPNVSVSMQGTFSNGTVSGTYTMGAGGELPGGQPITFNFSGTRQ